MTLRRGLVAFFFGSLFAASMAYGASLGGAPLKARLSVQPGTDNWLGGFGVWSNPAHWSDGIPWVDCDVYIGTGNDDVSLDVNSNVGSLSVGGANGISTLDGTLGQKLNVSGTTTVDTFGVFYLANGASLSSTDIQNSGFIGLFTSRDRVVAQSLTNYSYGAFTVGFGRADLGTVSNYGRVDVHNGGASLNVAGDFRNYALTDISFRAQLNVGGILSNLSDATMNVNGPSSGAAANMLLNYGALNALGASVSSTTLINGGSIQADASSKFQIGNGKAGGPGLYQYGDGVFAEAIGAGYFGVLTIDGPATLGGELDIVLDNGFTPLVGSMYRFLNFTPGNLSGTFSQIQNPYFDDGREMWKIEYNNLGGFVQLVAVPSPEPGSILLLSTGLLALGRLRRSIS